MLRVFNRDWDGGTDLPVVEAAEMHHLVRVRRVRKGEALEILNGRGAVGRCEVSEVSRKSAKLVLRETRFIEAPRLQVQLMVGLPKGKTFPQLLHKAVELGVAGITPMITQHAEVDPTGSESKEQRWQGILIEGLKQSGNPWLPVLSEPVTLAEAIDRMGADTVRLCAALQSDACPLWRFLETQSRKAGRIAVFVGPEGDFSEEEYAMLRQSNCQFVSLGPLVLKVETAASLLAGCIGQWARDEQN